MKKILCVLMSCLLFVMAGCSGHSKNLKFGAADIGGVYYSIASTFTQLADMRLMDIHLKQRLLLVRLLI